MEIKSFRRIILLVQGDPSIAEAEKRTLEKNGYDVKIVAVGERAADNSLTDRDIPMMFFTGQPSADVTAKADVTAGMESFPSYGYVVRNSDATVLLAAVRIACRLHDAEMEVQQGMGLYRILMENSIDAVQLLDENGRFLDINPRACEMVGYSRDEFLKMGIADINPDFSSADFPAYWRGKLKKNSVLFETRYQHKDGSVIPVEVNWIFCELNGKRYVFGVSRDVSERKSVEAQNSALIREKETLLKEVQHRVKNTMSTMAAMLSLQADSLTDPETIAVLVDAKSRFRSMEVLYDQLYRGDIHDSGSVRAYVSNLVFTVVALFPRHAAVRVEIAGETSEDCWIDAKRLSSLGMIINELITNAMKYAFRDQPDGRLIITFRRVEAGIFVEVADNGPGLPESRHGDDVAGFGMTMIHALVEQLRGTVRFERARDREDDHGADRGADSDSGGGTRVVLFVPDCTRR